MTGSTSTSISVAPQAPGRAAAQAWGPCACSADTRFGPLHLVLQGEMAAPPPASDTVCAGVLLGQAEPLLQLLEDWLGEPLDPRPAAGGPAQAGVLADAMLGSAGGEAMLHVRLQLPWAALQAQPPADAALRERLSVLHWQCVPMQLVLSRQRLDEAEWATLCQPGAALLLPESMAGGAWRCLLRPLEAPAMRQAMHWDAAQGRLCWADGEVPAQAEADGPVTLEVVLDELLFLTPPQLLRWMPDAACECRAGRVHVRRVADDGPVLQAELLPLGVRADGQPGWLARVEHALGASPAGSAPSW
ncbi:MAG: hypothetical protein AB1430_07540 [Pseudomonadota bacterium]